MGCIEDNEMVTEIDHDWLYERKRACVWLRARGFMRKETEENKLFSRIITKGATTTTTTTISHLIALSIQCIPFFLHDFITFGIDPISIRLHEIYSHFARYVRILASTQRSVWIKSGRLSLHTCVSSLYQLEVRF